MTVSDESEALAAVVRETDGGCLVSVRVTPRASASEIIGVSEGRLRIRLQAPPVDGAANTALIELLSKVCRLPKSSISVLRGDTGREKTIRIVGRSPGDLIEALKGRHT